MRALLLDMPNEVRIADLPVPLCLDGEVLVKVLGVGVCGSDLSVFKGHRQVPSYPWQMGHEAVGEIVGLGHGVNDREVGERVVIEPNYCCFTCGECLSGNTSGCLNRVIVGMAAPGVIAEYISVPSAFAWKVPSSLSVKEMICLEPLTVGAAALRRSGAKDGDKTLVIGAGSSGLSLISLLLSKGFSTYFIETKPGRSALATRIGALIHETGERYDQVFECSGTADGAQQAISLAADGATITLVGLSASPIEVVPSDLVRRRLTIVGSMIYDHPADFREMLDHIPEAISEIVGAKFTLDDAQMAFEGASEVPGKSWISLDDKGAYS